MWEAVYKRAAIDKEAAERVNALQHRFHLLVINEDWCGDSVNVLPYVARLAEASEHLEMRIVGRDANRDLMDAHLTGNARSIPIVIVYDRDFREKGWGPDWTRIEHLRNKQFRFFFNDLAHNRRGVQVGRRFTTVGTKLK